MHKKIEMVAKEVMDDGLRLVLIHVMRKYHETFATKPGARSIHHAYDGGLLNHSYDTAMTAKAIADGYAKKYSPPLDIDLILVGAFLHDTGKMLCYDVDEDSGKFISTAENRFHHHIPVGYHIVATETDRLVKSGELSEEHALQLLHIVVSHHGRVEYSSNRPPMTREAFIVSQADLIDSYMASPESTRKIFNN